METWFIIVLSLCIPALLKSLFHILFPSSFSRDSSSKKNKKLPPGPSFLSGNLILLTKSFSQLEPILRDLRLKYGPLITLKIGSRPAIFVGSHSIAHRVLIQKYGAVFSDRPRPPPASQLANRNQHNISSASYGPTWRLFRRNLASEILHPSRVKSFSWARRWVLGILMRRLLLQSQSDDSGSGSGVAVTVRVVDHFQFAMFCLLVLMCFGDKLDEDQIKQIERVQRRLLLSLGSGRYNVLNFWPRLGKIVFRNRWKEVNQLIQDRDQVLIPLIKARIEASKRQQGGDKEDDERVVVVAYVDTLVNLQLPEAEKRKLTYEEMVSLCGEFLNAGTDTTSTSLQWIMANLVKYPQIQDKLYREITRVVGPPPPQLPQEEDAVVKEEDLEKMPYLKAVVLEGLRRHPPGHFVLPHTVTEEVELEEGYVVPKGATVNFMVAEMGWDPKVWDEPMEFKPERFLFKAGEEEEEIAAAAFDVTGTKEIKMMPFGAGRRMCPASALALLHLEFFVANLTWYFKWTAADGDDVDLSEKQEFTVVMKHPLRAHISPRDGINK